MESNEMFKFIVPIILIIFGAFLKTLIARI
jgi:hypothetical protein